VSIRIEMNLDFEPLSRRITEAEPAALAQGMEHIRAAAVELTPVETGRLAGSATVHVDPEQHQASISYAGPYARYQHERLDLKHEHGQAKYLEQPMVTETEKVIGIVTDVLKKAL
jgi:hypothetical protein